MGITSPGVLRRIEPPPPQPQPFVPIHGWEADWDKPLGLRTGPDKGIWKTPSFRVQIRNKRSIKKMQAEARTQRINEAEMLKMRSMQSIEEMAEEERQAGREFLG
ncbi:Nn.00g106830.m01.CDS01 [Neocucurbitaria sp. VM-36]